MSQTPGDRSTDQEILPPEPGTRLGKETPPDAKERKTVTGPFSPVRFFVERFALTFAVFGALALFGFIQMPRLGVDLLPEIEIPVVAVSTVYPGASPEQVATQVSKPIEDQLTTLPGVSQVTSTNSEGLSLVIVQFDASQKVDQMAVDVSQRVSAVRASLPRDVLSPSVNKFDPGAQPVLSVAISAPGRDLSEVARVADERVQLALRRVEGVADVQLQGDPQRQVDVLLNPAQVQRYGLSPPAVAQAIGAASQNQSAGSLDADGQRTVYTLRSDARTAADVAAIVVDNARGLRVSDVATVRDTVVTPSTITRVNGQPVVTLSVRKAPGSNTVGVADAVNAELKTLELPDGFKAEVVSDTTTFIKATVDDTIKEVILALAVVSVVVLFFLGKLNTVFAVVLAIPISMSGALILMGLLGFTFNIITLLAIIVAVGIVVDDSIVVAENVERYRNMGLGAMESVLKGAAEVTSSVSAASLSLLAVFLPISFLPGLIGQFFSQFGLVMAAAILMSWLEALFFLTVRMAYTPDVGFMTWREFGGRLRGNASRFRTDLTRGWRRPLGLVGLLIFAGVLYFAFKLPGLIGVLAYPLVFAALRYLFSTLFALLETVSSSIFHATERGFTWLSNAYANGLERSLKRPWLVLTLAGALLASVAWVAPKLPFVFTPETDNGIVSATLELPAGTALSQTNTVTRRLEAELLKQPDVRTVETTVGSGGALGGSSAQNASLSIALVPRDEREGVGEVTARLDKVLTPLLADQPEAKLRVGATQTGPATTGVSLTLATPDFELLQSRSQQGIEALRATGNYTNVRSDLSATTQEQVFVPNTDRLNGTGITSAALAQTLRGYTSGVEAAKLNGGGEEVPIVVRADPRFAGNRGDLLSLPIYAPALQSSVPLSSLGRFETRTSPATLSRTDGQYSAAILADIAPGATVGRGAQTGAEKVLRDAGVLDDRVTLSTGGFDFLGDLVTTAPIAFGLALLLNYLVIASQFNTFRYPLYILLTVPLAIVGAIWMAYFLGTGLDIISILGLVLLIGLVTKNAILLLDFVIREAENMPLKEALIEAGRLRLRPILMTTATVLVISLPLILGGGEGGEFRKPLGVVTLGGVLTSTILTLFVVPAAFYQFERKNHDQKAAQRGVQERARREEELTGELPAPATD